MLTHFDVDAVQDHPLILLAMVCPPAHAELAFALLARHSGVHVKGGMEVTLLPSLATFARAADSH